VEDQLDREQDWGNSLEIYLSTCDLDLRKFRQGMFISLVHILFSNWLLMAMETKRTKLEIKDRLLPLICPM
jgi:hypothetical protein